MRSTSFFVFSVLLHVLALALILMWPQLNKNNLDLNEQSGSLVEMEVGAPDVTAGVAAGAEKPTAIEVPPAPVEPVVKAVPEVKIPEVKVKEEAPKKIAKVVPVIVKTPKTVEAKPVEKSLQAQDVSQEEKELPKKLDPQIDESAQENAAAAVPVEDNSALETQANNEDGAQEASEQTTGDGQEAASKGGATQAGAVSFQNLMQKTGNKPPSYPLAARRENRQGEVELLYRVTTAGQVADLKITKSSGHADLDQEAIKAIAKYKFEPGQEGWAKHPVTFSLKGTEQSLPSRLRTQNTQAGIE